MAETTPTTKVVSVPAEELRVVDDPAAYEPKMGEKPEGGIWPGDFRSVAILAHADFDPAKTGDEIYGYAVPAGTKLDGEKVQPCCEKASSGSPSSTGYSVVGADGTRLFFVVDSSPKAAKFAENYAYYKTNGSRNGPDFQPEIKLACPATDADNLCLDEFENPAWAEASKAVAERQIALFIEEFNAHLKTKRPPDPAITGKIRMTVQTRADGNVEKVSFERPDLDPILKMRITQYLRGEVSFGETTTQGPVAFTLAVSI